MASGKIVNGKDRPFGRQAAALPFVGAALNGMLEPMKFVIVTKNTINGIVQEVRNEYSYRASRQPLSAQKLAIKPEGQRGWKWETLYAEPNLPLKVDDVVIFNCEPFRVLEKHDWTEYGYIQYEIAQGFTQGFTT